MLVCHTGQDDQEHLRRLAYRVRGISSQRIQPQLGKYVAQFRLDWMARAHSLWLGSSAISYIMIPTGGGRTLTTVPSPMLDRKILNRQPRGNMTFPPSGKEEAR